MKAIHFFSALLCFLTISFSNTACAQWSGKKAKGKMTTQSFELKTINSIGLGIPATVHLSQANTQSIKIEGQEDVIAQIKTEVKKGHWNIKFKRGKNFNNYEPIHIHLSIRDLESLSIGGSGDIIGKNTFKGLDELSLSIGGSGDMSLSVEAKDIDTSIGGSGNITLAGNCNDFDISIAGSGDILAYDLKSVNCEISIAGSGNCKVTSAQSLDVSIVGSGDVYYKGNPKVSSSIIGSGDIERVN